MLFYVINLFDPVYISTTAGPFSAICFKWGDFCDFLVTFLHTKPMSDMLS